jgi:hypothetical protein
MEDELRSRVQVRRDDLDLARNCRTRVGTLAPVDIDRETMSAAYIAALRERDTAPPLPSGHRVYFRGHGLTGAIELPAEGAAYGIVGRHTACDIQLGGASAVSLRHLVLRSVRTSDATLSLRILDLHSTLGFRLSDGVVRRSVVVTGPVAIEVGGHILVGLPSGDLPETLPDAVFHEASALHKAPKEDSLSVSQVSVLRPATEVFERPRSSDPGAQPVFSLHRRRDSRAFQVSAEELDQGILVGRYPTAAVHGFLDKNVSRLHLLLIREEGTVFAVDLCSTNGTFVQDREIRRVELRPGLELRIGTGVTMRWNGLSQP